MIRFVCDFCGEVIPPAIIEKRHYGAKPPAQVYCNAECRVAHRIQRGDYKEMSEAGADRRSAALAKSNREHPRRRIERATAKGTNMTQEQWKQACKNMDESEFAALLQEHNAHLDSDTERSGTCTDCGAQVEVVRKYVIIPGTPANTVIPLGRFRDECCNSNF